MNELTNNELIKDLESVGVIESDLESLMKILPHGVSVGKTSEGKPWASCAVYGHGDFGVGLDTITNTVAKMVLELKRRDIK